MNENKNVQIRQQISGRGVHSIYVLGALSKYKESGHDPSFISVYI